MRTEIWLAIKSEKYKKATIRVGKSQPALKPNEIAFKLNIELPDALFTKPTLQASISVPASAVSPVVIEPLVIDNIQDTIKQQTGIDVKLSVEKVEGEDAGQ